MVIYLYFKIGLLYLKKNLVAKLLLWIFMPF